jgi:predicted ArsR family transcriptional regulator
MSAGEADIADSSAGDRILYLLKTRGPLQAADIGRLLGMTTVGARQHLANLKAAGLARFAARVLGRGRPKHVWSLTAAGHGRFPDRHSDLVLALIEGVRETLGAPALDEVIAAHERRQRVAYAAELAGAVDAGEAARRLAAIRSREGYMAEARALEAGDIQLVEHHCPICAAASACQGFCRAELAVFQAVLAPYGRVERDEHLLAGARRCAYRLRPSGEAS